MKATTDQTLKARAPSPSTARPVCAQPCPTRLPNRCKPPTATPPSPGKTAKVRSPYATAKAISHTTETAKGKKSDAAANAANRTSRYCSTPEDTGGGKANRPPASASRSDRKARCCQKRHATPVNRSSPKTCLKKLLARSIAITIMRMNFPFRVY